MFSVCNIVSLLVFLFFIDLDYYVQYLGKNLLLGQFMTAAI